MLVLDKEGGVALPTRQHQGRIIPNKRLSPVTLR